MKKAFVVMAAVVIVFVNFSVSLAANSAQENPWRCGTVADEKESVREFCIAPSQVGYCLVDINRGGSLTLSAMDWDWNGKSVIQTIEVAYNGIATSYVHPMKIQKRHDVIPVRLEGKGYEVFAKNCSSIVRWLPEHIRNQLHGYGMNKK